MHRSPDELEGMLLSGDTGLVNTAIDAVEALDPETALDQFDAIHAVGETVYDTGTGYQRQAAVRLLDALGTVWIAFVPGLGRVDLDPDDPIVEEVREARDACWEFFIDAVQDDDGRVRQSAVRAISTLATNAEFAERPVEREAATNVLRDARAACPDDAIREHINDAIRQIGLEYPPER
ncbi:MAG: hypothetical protein ABEH59_05590 [Halobacteriales archaeon]